MAEPVPPGFQTADSFLERFLIGLSDTHDFAYGAHLSSELVLHALEFLKRPAGKFDNDIVSVGYIFVEGSVFSAWDVPECQPGSQHGRNKCDRESGSLGGQCGGTGCPWVDLNDDDTVCCRVVGKLYICAADDLYRFNNTVSLLLKAFLAFLRDGQHRGRAERVAGVHAERVDVFDETYGNHIIF